MSQVRVLQRPYTSASADPWETLDVGGFEQPLRRRDQLLGLDSAHQHLGNEAVEGVVVLPAHDRKLGVTPLDGLAQPLDQVNCGSPPQGRRCAWATPSPSVLQEARKTFPDGSAGLSAEIAVQVSESLEGLALDVGPEGVVEHMPRALRGFRYEHLVLLPGDEQHGHVEAVEVPAVQVVLVAEEQEN